MTVIFRTTARTVVPIVLTVSVALFLQGHNLPGGGFIGGTLAATGFGLLYLAYGGEFLRTEILGVSEEPEDGDSNVRPGRSPGHRRAVSRYRAVFAAGLLIMVGGGLVPLGFSDPFLTQAVALVYDVPLYGEIELASALVFDLGVYAAVVGAVLTVLAEVGVE